MAPETSASRFKFNKQILGCVVGGVSALDIPQLNLTSEEEARQFILAYGYDLDAPEDRELLWATHKRAVALIQDQLLEPGEKVPDVLSDPAQLKSLTQLLLYASRQTQAGRTETLETHHQLQRWSCAVLRVMHVYVHLSNDLFSAFRDEIQTQILKPIQDAIVHDEKDGLTVLGLSLPDGGVKLHKFEIKPFKTTSSSVIKLLARPERVALTLLDKLGVRFVTRSVFDSFRVIRFLVENHLLSYPHIIPDQSNNTLYPLNLFLEVIEELTKIEGSTHRTPTPAEIQDLLNDRLSAARARAEYLEKPNEFSAPDYRFIKFISRKLVTISIGKEGQSRAFRFFYPYEIQVMDQETYVRNLSGPMAHDEYKNRQKRKARDRVFGLASGVMTNDVTRDVTRDGSRSDSDGGAS